MHSMASEPARLQAEQHRVKRELAAAAVEHYPVLVEAAERSGDIASFTQRGVAHAAQSNTALEKLKDASHALQTAGAAWRRDKGSVTTAVSSASKVAEILDAPATLEACLRADMYHEARLVTEHVRSLKEAMPDSRVIDQVFRRTNHVLETLVQSVVLPRLAGNLSVAVALKITSFLRHLGVDEGELRDRFLELRTDFVNAFVGEEELADGAVPAAVLKRILVHWKVVVTDAIATFNGCFPSSEQHRLAIALWAHDRSQQLIGLWDKYLPRVLSGVDLADLAVEVSHCSAPWASVGMDLSPLLLETVAARVGQIFAATVEEGVNSFVVALANPSWRQSPMSMKPANADAAGSSGGDGAPTAPPRIVQCLPLTYVAHSIVSACNDARRCAALASWPTCFAALEGCINRVVDEVRSIKDEGAPSPEEQASIDALESIALDDCVPFVTRCLDFVFDRSEAQDVLVAKAWERYRAAAA